MEEETSDLSRVFHCTRGEHCRVARACPTGSSSLIRTSRSWSKTQSCPSTPMLPNVFHEQVRHLGKESVTIAESSSQNFCLSLQTGRHIWYCRLRDQDWFLKSGLHMLHALELTSIIWTHVEGHPHAEGTFTGTLVKVGDLRRNSGECQGGSREYGVVGSSSSREGARLLPVPADLPCK